MENYLRVGVISSTHGIHGEVKVFPTTDDVKRFKKLKNVIIDTKKEYINMEIKSVKFFKQFAIIGFKGYDDINQIEKYKGCDLLIDRKDAIPLAPNEYFICDLIGCEIITDDGSVLGELTDVMTTGANDVYIVTTKEGKEILLPVIDECVLDINIEEKRIKVHIMKGLLDL